MNRNYASVIVLQSNPGLACYKRGQHSGKANANASVVDIDKCLLLVVRLKKSVGHCQITFGDV